MQKDRENRTDRRAISFGSGNACARHSRQSVQTSRRRRQSYTLYRLTFSSFRRRRFSTSPLLFKPVAVRKSRPHCEWLSLVSFLRYFSLPSPPSGLSSFLAACFIAACLSKTSPRFYLFQTSFYTSLSALFHSR